MKVLRWLAKNLGTLLTAIIMAVIVWVSSVVASDPNEEHILARSVPIEIIGQDPGLQLMGDVTRNVTLVLRAPASVWTVLNTDQQSVHASADLTNLGPGEHIVPVQVQITPRLVRKIRQDPQQLTITLDSIVSQKFSVNLIVNGTPPVGYEAQPPWIDPTEVTVTGPESLVSTVNEARVIVDITNINQSIVREQAPVLLDEQGKVVNGLKVTPDTVTVNQPITLLGGYRYVIVRAVSTGQVANGYRLTNIFVSPVGVVVFSSNPELVNNLPGYVGTQSIDLSGKEDDFETLVELNLPSGISVVGDPKVLVQVSIAAIESSLAISLPVEVINLAPGLEAVSSPTSVDVILSGPVPVLNTLGPTDVRAVVDLSGYEEGVYQLIPQINILPERVEKVSILPATVEITITTAPTPTQTGTPSGALLPLGVPIQTATVTP
ncbi:MAG: YbbR-like domain-containing protein [Acidobacteriaceae bacterium]